MWCRKFFFSELLIFLLHHWYRGIHSFWSPIPTLWIVLSSSLKNSHLSLDWNSLCFWMDWIWFPSLQNNCSFIRSEGHGIRRSTVPVLQFANTLAQILSQKDWHRCLLILICVASKNYSSMIDVSFFQMAHCSLIYNWSRKLMKNQGMSE